MYVANSACILLEA